MDDDVRYFATLMLEGRILGASGAVYEDLFTHVMSMRNERFTPIKPQGRIGDRKNDGYDPSEGRFYQVYAPENPTQSVAKAVEKATTDFDGLKGYWSTFAPVRHYHFVYNDKLLGVFPTIERALAELRLKHGLESASVFRSSHLIDQFAGLTPLQMRRVVGFVPSPELIGRLAYDDLTEVVSHLLNQPVPNGDGALVVPDFDDKLQLNHLSGRSADVLRLGSYEVGAVQGYFLSRGDNAQVNVRNRLRTVYEDAVTEHGLPSGSASADRILAQLAAECVPTFGAARVYDTAIASLLAFFFEACDIFEEPH